MNPITEGHRHYTGPDPKAKGFNRMELTDAYYSLVSDARQAQLLLESVTMAEVDEGYNPDPDYDENDGREESIMESIRVKQLSRTPQTMAALRRALNKQMADKGLEVGEAVIGKPKKSGLFATVTVQFPISDGQTLTIVFHSPDGNKMQIAASDEILAYRWLLNKRDITVAVSPDGEEDVSLEEVGKRTAQLVEKNSTRFQATQKDIQDQKTALEALKQQVADAQANNTGLSAQLAESLSAADSVEMDLERAKRMLTKLQETNSDLENQLTQLQAVAKGNDGKGDVAEREPDWETKPPYDDEYNGPRFKYGLMNRPFSIGTQPKGSILQSYKPDDHPENSLGKARYGTLEYPFRLTDKEVYDFELLDLNGAAEDADNKAFQEQFGYFAEDLAGRGFIKEVDNGVTTFKSTAYGPQQKVICAGMDSVESGQNSGYMVTTWVESNDKEDATTFFKCKTVDGIEYQTELALDWIDKKIASFKGGKGGKDDKPLQLSTFDLGEISKYVASAKKSMPPAKIRDTASGELSIAQFGRSNGADEWTSLYKEETARQLLVAADEKEAELAADNQGDITDPEPGPKGNAPGIDTLNAILAGEYAGSQAISDALDQAASDLEAAGLMDKYDGLLNEAADYLTTVLKKEAA